MSSDLVRGILATLDLARSVSELEVPVSAIVTDVDGQVLATGVNNVYRTRDHTAHAEIEALRKLGMTGHGGSKSSLTMYVLLEPCPMCAWAIRTYGLGRVVFGAYNTQYGAAGSFVDLLRDGRGAPSIEVIGGVAQDQCEQFLSTFWQSIRDNG